MKGPTRSHGLYSQGQIFDALEAAGYVVDHGRAQCPTHEGDDLNLSVTEDANGAAIIKCHSQGCSAADVIVSLRDHLGPAEIRVSNAERVTAAQKQRPAALEPVRSKALDGYAAALFFDPPKLDVLEEERAISREVVRLAGIGWLPNFGERSGRFSIPLRDPSGVPISFVGHLPRSMRSDGVPGVMSLPGWPRWPLALLDADVISTGLPTIVCEGELDALAVRSAGFPSYGAPGASSWNDGFASELRDDYGVRNVVVIGDLDDAGLRFANKAVSSLIAAGISARIVELPESLGEGGDLTDLLRSTEPHTRHEALRDLVGPVVTTEPVDLASLLTQITDFLCRFVRFPDERQQIALALHIVAAHALDAFDVAPYIAVTSAEKRSGKTRTIEVVELFYPRSWRISGAPSLAALFRKIESEEPVVLIDEADLLFAMRDDTTRAIVAVVNAGYRRGATVPRVVGDGSNMSTVDFSVFGVKVLAGIDATRWPDTVRDRCIVVNLKRRTTGERVERFRRRDVEPEADAIRTKIETWSATNIAQLREHRVDDLDAIDDRAFEVWEPLFAVADLAGGEWPTRAREAALVLSSSREAESDSLGVRLLLDLRTVFGAHAADGKLSSADVLTHLNALDESPWSTFRDGRGIDAFQLGRMLRAYGVSSKSLRSGHLVFKGFDADELRDAWNRYLPSPSAEPVTSVTPVTSPRNEAL